MPTQLIVGLGGDYTIKPEHRLVVSDGDFVRDLFSTLKQPATNSFKHFLLLPPYAFIFVDAEGEVCGGFRYSACSKPECVFWPCWVERRDEDYVITRGWLSTNGIVVPGFTERFRVYMDLLPMAEVEPGTGGNR